MTLPLRIVQANATAAAASSSAAVSAAAVPTTAVATLGPSCTPGGCARASSLSKRPKA
jgi:hypothetical protein